MMVTCFQKRLSSFYILKYLKLIHFQKNGVQNLREAYSQGSRFWFCKTQCQETLASALSFVISLFICDFSLEGEEIKVVA